MLILGQKSCFLRPTFFKIPQPNWYWYISEVSCFFTWYCEKILLMIKIRQSYFFSGQNSCQNLSYFQWNKLWNVTKFIIFSAWLRTEAWSVNSSIVLFLRQGVLKQTIEKFATKFKNSQYDCRQNQIWIKWVSFIERIGLELT